MRRLLLPLLCLCGFYTTAQTPAADSLTAALQQLAASSGLPGFAVAVVDSGGIRFERGFGLADRATQRPFTPGTVQEVGSVSKTLIGIGLLKGVELGYFTLDTPINDLLPWPVRNPRQPAGVIRIRDLATHTSGIVDVAKTYQQGYVFGPRATQIRFDGADRAALGDFLRSYLTPEGKRYGKRNFAPTLPGEAYAYSNIGAALAGYLLELKSGLSYAEFTRRHILQPAGMSASGWSYPDFAGQPQATGYRANGKPYPPYVALTYPDGGLHSSARDLALYLRQVIRGAAGRPGLLTAASFRELLAPRFAASGPPTGRNPREPNSGMFWAIRPDGTVGHVGSDPGVFAALFFDPQTGIGRVFLTNVEFDDAPALAQQFAAIWKTVGKAEGRLLER